MKEKEKRELAFGKVAVTLLAIVGLLFIVWFAWIRPEEAPSSVDSYEACVAAGYPVRESYPEVCATPSGQQFINPSPATDLPLVQ